MGENGAGKSTLIKILAGVTAPDSAQISVDGRPASIENTKSAYRLGLRFIHQEFNVVPTLSVAENIFMGRLYPRPRGAPCRLDRAQCGRQQGPHAPWYRSY